VKDTIKKILFLFSKKEKKKLIILFLMMIIAAVFETAGIGLIVPFVGVITNPDVVQEEGALAAVYKLLKFNSTTSFIIFSVIIFLTVFVVKNSYLLLYNYVQAKIVLNQQVKLSRNLFKEYLTKPYTFHLQRNTADLLRNVNGEVPKVFQGIIMSGFQLITELLITFCILVLLLLASPVATITASILLMGSVTIFFKFFRVKISQLGKEQQKVSATMIQWVNQGLGANKEIKVSGRESFFVTAYTKQSQIKANNSIYMKMLDQVPRLFIETLLVSIVLLTMLIIIIQGSNTSQVVSTMALFAMAAFRLMPSITRIVSLIATIKYSIPALTVIHEDLYMKNDSSIETRKEMNDLRTSITGNKTFHESIELKNVSFQYPDQKEYTIKDISLTIPIGQSVAFVGESGAGKTTLIDIILGLYSPQKGEVLVDEIELKDQKPTWQKSIGYIPQSIFLSDDSIRGNVAFGIPKEKIDDKAVWKALKQAQLKDFVESLPKQLDTNVGERGVRLSGGQRQRIGIARALYHDPEIIFMDEATSALDNKTEREIMKAIDNLKKDKTIIIIAHRLSTIENCDIVYKLSKGKLISVDTKTKLSTSAI
jgi:ATP-binding cassette, subfamily B, bacterial PglK